VDGVDDLLLSLFPGLFLSSAAPKVHAMENLSEILPVARAVPGRLSEGGGNELPTTLACRWSTIPARYTVAAAAVGMNGPCAARRSE
jgi:hypothetical protein